MHALSTRRCARPVGHASPAQRAHDLVCILLGSTCARASSRASGRRFRSGCVAGDAGRATQGGTHTLPLHAGIQKPLRRKFTPHGCRHAGAFAQEVTLHGVPFVATRSDTRRRGRRRAGARTLFTHQSTNSSKLMSPSPDVSRICTAFFSSSSEKSKPSCRLRARGQGHAPQAPGRRAQQPCALSGRRAQGARHWRIQGAASPREAWLMRCA